MWRPGGDSAVTHRCACCWGVAWTLHQDKLWSWGRDLSPVRSAGRLLPGSHLLEWTASPPRCLETYNRRRSNFISNTAVYWAQSSLSIHSVCVCLWTKTLWDDSVTLSSFMQIDNSWAEDFWDLQMHLANQTQSEKYIYIIQHWRQNCVIDMNWSTDFDVWIKNDGRLHNRKTCTMQLSLLFRWFREQLDKHGRCPVIVSCTVSVACSLSSYLEWGLWGRHVFQQAHAWQPHVGVAVWTHGCCGSPQS